MQLWTVIYLQSYAYFYINEFQILARNYLYFLHEHVLLAWDQYLYIFMNGTVKRKIKVAVCRGPNTCFLRSCFSQFHLLNFFKFLFFNSFIIFSHFIHFYFKYYYIC